MLKVLIVEDNILLADLLEDFLVSENYDVCGTATTVSEAVVLADLHKPDLAILDFRLADGDYGSQIRPLLEDKRSMGILYASGDPLNKALTKLDGDAYLQKPYGMQDMISALRIIRGIKVNDRISHLHYPKNFQLLTTPSNEERMKETA